MFLTVERKIIMQAIEETDDWFFAENIMRQVNKRGIRPARSTIYRNLELLCMAGIIENRHRPGEKNTFRRCKNDKTVYMIQCKSCNHEHEINDPALELAVTQLCEKHDLNTTGMVIKVNIRHRCHHCLPPESRNK